MTFLLSRKTGGENGIRNYPQNTPKMHLKRSTEKGFDVAENCGYLLLEIDLGVPFWSTFDI